MSEQVSSSPPILWHDKHNSGRRYREALKRMRMTNFRGGTLEIHRDCSFDDLLIQHIRAKIVTVSWRNGKPYMLRFTSAVEFLQQGRSTDILWETPESGYWLEQGYWNCQRRTQCLLFERGAFESIWEKEGCFAFRDRTGTAITLFPSGIEAPNRPFFYETPEEHAAFFKLFEAKTSLESPTTETSSNVA